MLQTVDKRMATACALKEERLLHDQLASSEERQDRSTDVAEAVLWTDTVRDYRQGRSHNEPSPRSSEKSLAFKAANSHIVCDPNYRPNRDRSSSRPNHDDAHGRVDDHSWAPPSSVETQQGGNRVSTPASSVYTIRQHEKRDEDGVQKEKRCRPGTSEEATGKGNHDRTSGSRQTEAVMREQLLSLGERERESSHEAETWREKPRSAHSTLAQQLQPQLHTCVVQLLAISDAEADSRWVTDETKAQEQKRSAEGHRERDPITVNTLNALQETKTQGMDALYIQQEQLLDNWGSVEVKVMRAAQERDASAHQEGPPAAALKRELEACQATLLVVRQSCKETRKLRAQEALDFEFQLSGIRQEYQAVIKHHEERYRLAEVELCRMHAAVLQITEDTRLLSHHLEGPHRGTEQDQLRSLSVSLEEKV